MAQRSLYGAAPVAPFLKKTYDMVNDAATDHIISWTPNGASFTVKSTETLSKELLPRHFRHNNFSSFVRQLNTYRFQKIDPDSWTFKNEYFVRGRPDQLGLIVRKTTDGQKTKGGGKAPASTWAANSPPTRTLLVSAAILIDPSTKKVLLAERPKGVLKGTFEFPGGKVEPFESPEEALVRELYEELGIIVNPANLTPVTFASHGYDKFHLLMPLYATTKWEGSLGSVGLEGQRLVFVTGEELEANAYPMPPADAPLIPEIIRFLNR